MDLDRSSLTSFATSRSTLGSCYFGHDNARNDATIADDDRTCTFVSVLSDLNATNTTSRHKARWRLVPGKALKSLQALFANLPFSLSPSGGVPLPVYPAALVKTAQKDRLRLEASKHATEDA